MKHYRPGSCLCFCFLSPALPLYHAIPLPYLYHSIIPLPLYHTIPLPLYRTIPLPLYRIMGTPLYHTTTALPYHRCAPGTVPLYHTVVCTDSAAAYAIHHDPHGLEQSQDRRHCNLGIPGTFGLGSYRFRMRAAFCSYPVWGALNATF